MSSFSVAIIGRPNVGKSTLFNRLTGKKHALVDDSPGVTRDRREGEASLFDLDFTIVDTAGLDEDYKKDSLEKRIFEQTKIAIEQADVCLFMIDGQDGVTPIDESFAVMLRKEKKDVILVVNKTESSRTEANVYEALGLGFDVSVPISAEHGEGMDGLYEALKPFSISEGDEVLLDLDNNKSVQIAIVGRPNSGKSTFMNALLGMDRVLTGPEAGITRDSISYDWSYKDQAIKLIDTAGIRKKAKVQGKLEKLSVTDSLRAVQYSHVCILMLDATQALEKQDIAIADAVIQEGRGIVIALNKWDLVKNKAELLDEVQYRIGKTLSVIDGVPIVTLSALDNDGCHKVIDAALEVYEDWDTHISTSKLNLWLDDVEASHPPPLGKSKRVVRLKYVTQGKNRPPTFMVFVNRPEDVPESYQRYLLHSLRKTFGLTKIPIRLWLRKPKNPYENKSKK